MRASTTPTMAITPE